MDNGDNEDAAAAREDAKEFFLARREEFDQKVSEMPSWFQERYARLYGDLDKNWDSSGFEIFVYEDAIKVIDKFGNAQAVKVFHGMTYSEQSKILGKLNISPQHTTFSFEAALRIAYQYLKETSGPERTA